MSEQNAKTAKERPPAKFDRWINAIPDLDEGDRVHVKTDAGYAPDRNLTVSKVGVEATPSAMLATRFDDDPGYLLEGYGTEYKLFAVGTEHWAAVEIASPSMDTGQEVSGIELLEKSEEADA